MVLCGHASASVRMRAFLPWLWRKAAAWDKVIGPVLGYASSTDPLTGALAWGFNIVLSGLFLHTWINRT